VTPRCCLIVRILKEADPYSHRVTTLRFVVCGDDPLAHSLVDELTSRYNAQVTVILPDRRRNHGPQLDALPGVKIVEAEQLDAQAFRSAKLQRAHGLALVQQDDVGNIHAALRAQELCSDLRLVIRMFNMSLGHAVRRLFRDCAVLSDASIAAPELVAAALGEVAPHFVRLPGRTLYVARRADVHQRDIVCGIAVTDADQPPEVLPADDQASDLVLAVANRRNRPAHLLNSARMTRLDSVGSTVKLDPGQEGVDPKHRDAGEDVDSEPAVSEPRQYRRITRRRRLFALPRALLTLVDSKLEIATLILILLIAAGVVTISWMDHLTLWQAFYTTLIMAVDAGEPDLKNSLFGQIVHTVVALSGIALVPVLTATVVNAVVNARLAVVLGRLRSPISGHVVVIGLGNVGTRVIRMLHELGHEVVAIDKSESARGVPLAHELGIPLIIGDGSEEETLRQASVRTCQAMLALSTSDVANLEAALHARHLRPGLRVVMRLFDHDLAQRVESAFHIPISRSVSALAAPAFAAALMEREVIGTIAVGRRVLLIAEVLVTPESPLAGGSVADVVHSGELRIIALTGEHDSRPQWMPSPLTPLSAGDRLTVIANRTGLSRILAASAPPTPEPSPEDDSTGERKLRFPPRPRRGQNPT
jgi:Trk K+ transport system NAD-binding subunit